MSTNSSRFKAQSHGGLNQTQTFGSGKKGLIGNRGWGREDQFMQTQMHVNKVSQAKEFESFRNIPKFSKPTLAVIHPSPKKKHRQPMRADPNLEFDAVPFAPKPYQRHVRKIPEHLTRPPIEVKSEPRRPQSAATRQGKPLNARERKLAEAEKKRQMLEAKKLAKVSKNLKLCWTEIKKCLDQEPDEQFHEKTGRAPVSKAKNENSNGRLVKWIFQTMHEVEGTGRSMLNLRMTQPELIHFVRTFVEKDLTDRDIKEIFNVLAKKKDGEAGAPTHVRSLSLGSPQSSQNSEEAVKLDITVLEAMYTKWHKEEESVGNIYNQPKLIKQKFIDFRLKIKVWKAQEKKRKRVKKSYMRHTATLRQVMAAASENFDLDNDKIQYCIEEFDNMQEEITKNTKEEIIINNFLSQLSGSDGSTIEIKELKRVSDNLARKFNDDNAVLYEFVNTVKTECVLNGSKFSFFDIPDLILKKKFNKTEYEAVMKVLMKVKTLYLQQKLDEERFRAEEAANNDPRGRDNDKKKPEEAKIEDMVVTEDDMVPLDLFDVVMDQIEYKMQSKKVTWAEQHDQMDDAIRKKVKELNPQTEKQRKVVEAFAAGNILNERLENLHKIVWTGHYKHNLLYFHFGQNKHYSSAEDFKQKFQSIMDADKSKTRYNEEYKTKLANELQIFTGKVALGENEGETETSMSAATRISKPDGARVAAQSAAQVVAQSGRRVSKFAPESPAKTVGFAPTAGSDPTSPDFKIDKGTMKKSELDDRLETLAETGGGEAMSLADLAKERTVGREEAAIAEEQAMIAEEEADEEKKNAEGSDVQWAFKEGGPSGKDFDPKKKFGVLEDEGELLYDNITTSYGLNLPPDYYVKMIQNGMPQKSTGQEGDNKWYIRPHHLESLTNHANSLKDDVLNTRYFSHYNQDYGKEPQIKETEKAIWYVERHIEKLKMQQRVMATTKGINELDLDEIKEKDAHKHRKAYEKFISENARPKEGDPTPSELCIGAYEDILTHQRKNELGILNGQRFQEYEKNRRPANKWYEFKDKQFCKELYRNRMALKPNDTNKVYLETLQDPYLY